MYTDVSRMLDKYQNDVVPDLRKQLANRVEVVRGEWVDGYAVDHNGKKIYDSIDCSVCEEIFKIESHDREYWKGRFKTCPFCGADMRERSDGE